jgi:hypothetical protein
MAKVITAAAQVQNKANEVFEEPQNVSSHI